MPAPPSAPVRLTRGARMPVATFGPITRTDIVRYAGAGGDMNPIHHDEDFARTAGAPTVFAMGLLHGGVLGMRLARWVGPNNVRRLSLRFVGQVWPGDELTITGVVERIEDETERRLAHIDVGVERQTGDLVIVGAAVAEVAR